MIAVRGGGEMASAAARLLFLAGFRVLVLEREQPLAVRRLVCFAEAVWSGAAVVEGVRGVSLPAGRAADALERREGVPVAVDPEGRLLAALRPDVIVDGRMQKANLGTTLRDTPLVVGLGPGFFAGRDVHAVVETQRGPDLGRVIWSGAAEADSGRPAPIAGVAEERVLRAPRAGTFLAKARIGELISAGSSAGEVDGEPVLARVSGLVRGLLADGVSVSRGTKAGDVDPRGRAVDPARISDKARAVAAGVLEAVVVGLPVGAPVSAGRREEQA